jgi:hypothetical protein
MKIREGYASTFPKESAAFCAAARKHNRCAILNTPTGLWLGATLARIEDGVLMSTTEADRLARYIHDQEVGASSGPVPVIRDAYSVRDVIERIEQKAKA